MPMPSKLNLQAGFTLLEILAAFLVFSISAAIAMQGMSASLRNTRLSGNLTQVALYAQSKMDLLGIEAPIEEGSDSGDFDDDYRWSMTIELYDPADERGIDPDLIPVDLYQITLEVFWQQGVDEQSTLFTTLYAQDRNFESREFGG